MIKRNYETPAPIINDIGGTIEDVAGSLTTSQTLLGSLIGDIEGMQDIARQQKERPGTISADAVSGRLDDLWAMGDAISQRLGDNITVLYAVVEKDSQPAPPPSPSELFGHYMALTSALSASGDDDTVRDALANSVTDAMWAYAEDPATTIPDLIQKMTVLEKESLAGEPRAIGILLRDLRSLARQLGQM